MNIVLLTFLIGIGLIIIPYIIGKIKEKVLKDRYDIYECWINGLVIFITFILIMLLSFLIAYLILNYKQG